MKKLPLFSLISLSVFLLDQLTKHLVKGMATIELLPYVRLRYATNTGAGFSLLQGYTLMLILVSIVVIGLIFYYYPKIKDRFSLVALSLVLGGAVGNLIDRLLYGQVIDFVSVWIWPTFNVADAAITVGVIMLAIKLWKN